MKSTGSHRRGILTTPSQNHLVFPYRDYGSPIQDSTSFVATSPPTESVTFLSDWIYSAASVFLAFFSIARINASMFTSPREFEKAGVGDSASSRASMTWSILMGGVCRCLSGIDGIGIGSVKQKTRQSLSQGFAHALHWYFFGCNTSAGCCFLKDKDRFKVRLND